MAKTMSAETILADRQRAYLQAFDPENLSVAVVLQDLEKFCRANETTFHSDPRIHAALEGRREVWLRIQQHLKLNLDQLLQLYGKKVS